MDPQNRFLFVPTSYGIAGYAIDGSTGGLTALLSPWPNLLFPGTASAGVSFDGTGNFMYASQSGTGNLWGFAVDPASGNLTPVPGSPFLCGANCYSVAGDASGQYLYAISDNGVLAYAINAATGTLTYINGVYLGGLYKSVTYPAGSAPGAIAFDGTNIWVTNSGFGTVTKLLAATGATVGTYPAGSGTSQRGIAFDGTNIWVTSYAYGGTVTKLLASTGETVGTYSVGGAPFGVAFDGTNIWVTNWGMSGSVTKLLASTGATVGTYPVGSFPEGIAFDGTNIWVANSSGQFSLGNVTKLLASTGATLGTYPVGASPQGIAFDGTNIWEANTGSNDVTELSASTGATVGIYPVGTQPSGIVFDGTNIWVANSGSGTVTKISPAAQ